MKQTAVCLPNATYDRLRALASGSGRTATFHIREAIDRYLEDLDDLNAVETAANEHRESGGRTLSLDELDDYLGLEDCKIRADLTAIPTILDGCSDNI